MVDGGPAGPDFAFLVEREMFAQEEILGRERAAQSETENHKVMSAPMLELSSGFIVS